MIVERIKAVLQSALPETVPILLPEEIELPKAGRTPGKAGGYTAYLAAHPTGYVQIESPLAITSDGLTGTFWVAVASVAPTAASAATLAAQVRAALCGTPWEPGNYLEVTPAQPEALGPGAWIVRPTFDALTLNGQPQ